MPIKCVAVGAAAPDFVLRGASHSSLCVSALRGRPVVVAFCDGWSPGGSSAEEVSKIRAELRGIGAVLIVLSDTGAWSFRPDDDVERFAEQSDALAADIAAAARGYGVRAPSSGGSSPPAVFVLDEEGAVRFAHVRGGPSEEIATTLAGALTMAGCALTTNAPITSAPTTSAPTTKEVASIVLSRREWVTASLVAAFTLAFVDGCGRPSAPRGSAAVPSDAALDAGSAGEVTVRLNVNGEEHSLRIEPRVSLLDALRERLALTGTKKGCDHGQCGACTVLVDGRRVNACLTLAIMTEGAKVTTIEGLAQGDVLHPLQAAFVEADGFQCGYCTPGQIMSAVGLLSEGHAKTDDEVREEMSGNLCRCGAYPNIVQAVQLARSRPGAAGSANGRGT